MLIKCFSVSNFFVATSQFLPTLTGSWLIPDTLLHFSSLDQTISCLHTSTSKKKKQTKYLGAGRGPDPVLGFAVSSMVVGQKPLCLLVYQFKSGCSVEFITGNNNMGKQVEVRFCSANINLIPLWIIQLCLLLLYFHQRVSHQYFCSPWIISWCFYV